jgi:hypothetical protein
MDAGRLPELVSGFVSLLLLPALGVIGLMHRRAIPVLRWTLAGWAVLGGLALLTGHTAGWSESAFRRTWLLGLGLGAAFLLVALAHRDRRIAPWIRLALAAMTVAVFVRSLWEFVGRYA